MHEHASGAFAYVDIYCLCFGFAVQTAVHGGVAVGYGEQRLKLLLGL